MWSNNMYDFATQEKITKFGHYSALFTLLKLDRHDHRIASYTESDPKPRETGMEYITEE